MRKILLLLLFLMTPTFGADKIHVKALTDFSTNNPKDHFIVEVIEDGSIDSIPILKGDVINCKLTKIVSPKRAKQNAKIYFSLLNYEDNIGEHYFPANYSAKYAKTVVNKEEIKKAPKGKIAEKTAGFVGGYFIKGFSYGVSFVDGVVQNPEDNRLKSGVKQVYEDSFLSLIEQGKQIEIKEDDIFYFIVKQKD